MNQVKSLTIVVGNASRKVFVTQRKDGVLVGAVGSASFAWNKKRYDLPVFTNMWHLKGEKMYKARKLAKLFIEEYLKETELQVG